MQCRPTEYSVGHTACLPQICSLVTVSFETWFNTLLKTDTLLVYFPGLREKITPFSLWTVAPIPAAIQTYNSLAQIHVSRIIIIIIQVRCAHVILLVRYSAIEKTTIILFPYLLDKPKVIFCIFIQPYIVCIDAKMQWSKCIGIVAWVTEQSELLCFCDNPSRGWEYLISRS